MLPEHRQQILVVDDEVNLRRVLNAQLTRDGYDVHGAANGDEALRLLAEHHVDLMITDLRMPGMDGVELLQRALRQEPDLPVVMITAHGTVDTAVEALKSGAFDYITKPFDQEEVLAIVRKALAMRRLGDLDSRRSSSTDPHCAGFLVGSSSAVGELRMQLIHGAQERLVTLYGESGTGKERLARAIHQQAGRAERPFIKLNCAAVEPAALEQELFGRQGHVPGGSKPGRLELAHGGTLLLTEIERLSIPLQDKLARAVVQGESERVGGLGAIRSEVRLIVATQQAPAALAADGRLGLPLRRLLGGSVIRVPALRERPEDIPQLSNYFLAQYGEAQGKAIQGFTEQAMAALQRYLWPGNLRELSNVIERAVLFCQRRVVDVGDLIPEVAGYDRLVQADVGQGLREQVKEATSKLERELIHRALSQTRGNVTHAARLLKISRKGLQLKMKELGLRDNHERPL